MKLVWGRALLSSVALVALTRPAPVRQLHSSLSLCSFTRHATEEFLKLLKLYISTNKPQLPKINLP